MTETACGTIQELGMSCFSYGHQIQLVCSFVMHTCALFGLVERWYSVLPRRFLTYFIVVGVQSSCEVPLYTLQVKIRRQLEQDSSFGR